MRGAILVVIAFLAVPCAAATDPWLGRWANDIRACESAEHSVDEALIVTPNSLKWPQTLCTVALSYKLRDSWHISARCWGEGHVSTLPITLRMNGKRLLLDWARAPTEELRRCP